MNSIAVVGSHRPSNPAIAALRRILLATLVGLPGPALAQDKAPGQGALPIEQRVDDFVAQLEARRKELGMVGAAIVVVHRDRILRVAGLGQRNADSMQPVTEDTLFPLASATKQFTAIAVALAVGEGRMAFEDHPRRFVPDFRLKDPEADAKLNLIDLLAHRSGLDRSDFTFRFGSFTQAELFQLAGRATPGARLREKMLYNNTMFSLAGAALARAYDTTYERFMTERLLIPLGMRASTFSFDAFMAASNRAAGYGTGADGKPSAVTPIDIAAIAPAGALHSTARDMAAWLLFLNARGQSDGLKISPAAYARVFENHTLNAAEIPYGLGFQVEVRSGVRIAHHGGNVPGYTTDVFHLPERGLSYALLVNQDSSGLREEAQELFWRSVVRPELPADAAPRAEPAPPPAAASPIALDLLVGEYFRSQGTTFEIKKTDAGFVVILPGVPPVPLKPVGVNRYDLPGLGGYTLSFAEDAGMAGRFVGRFHAPPSEGGSAIVFYKKDAAWLASAKARHGGAHGELIGHYHTADRKTLLEVVPYRDGVALIDTAEAPRLLIPAGKDLFRLEGQPETHRLQFRRSGANSVIGFVLQDPKRTLEMIIEPAGAGDPERARAILERAVAAAGGREALDGLTSKLAIGRAVAATHGVDGPTEDRIVPGKRAWSFALGAFGKTIVGGRSVSDERSGYVIRIDGARVPITGKGLAAARLAAVPHPLYRWQERFATVAWAGETIVNGQHAFVIELTPQGLDRTRLYIAADTHLVLREDTPTYVGDTFLLSLAVDYSDYRTVNGIRVPFAMAMTVPLLDRIVLVYDSVVLGGPIDPKVFDTR